MNRAAAQDRTRRLGRAARGPTITANLIARVGALAALTTASPLVTRTGGPATVGTLARLRVLPRLAGLHGAASSFLSGPGRADPRYGPTLPAMAALASALAGDQRQDHRGSRGPLPRRTPAAPAPPNAEASP